MRKDCHEEAKREGFMSNRRRNNFEANQTQISNVIKSRENSSSSRDLFVPSFRGFRSSIPKQITTFDDKHAHRCFELIRGYAFKAAAWKFTSKVDALPDDLNNLQKFEIPCSQATERSSLCAETELTANSNEDSMVNISKRPLIQRFGSMDSDVNHAKIGLLQCKWKNGLTQHMFIVDDKREILLADLSKEVSSVVDYVYTFRSSKRNKIIGKMQVSTSITIGCDNTESEEETTSVLSVPSDEHLTEDEQIGISDRSLRKDKRVTRKVANVFRSNHSFKRIPSSKFDGSSAFSVPYPVETSGEKRSAPNLELSAIVIKRAFKNRKVADDSGGWGLKFLTNLGRNESSETSESLECTRNDDECSTSMNVLIPNGIHGGPRTSSSLTERWISGGRCDCGGWDIACPLTILSQRSYEFDDSDQCKSVDLYVQGSKQDFPAMKMVKIREGLYYIRFRSTLSTVQSFAIATAIVHSRNPVIRSKLYRCW